MKCSGLLTKRERSILQVVRATMIDDTSQPSLDLGTRNQQPRNFVGASGSPTSIRDHFAEEIMIVRPMDDSPFDEPPFQKGNRHKKAPRRKYSLDGYSFYQSSAQIEDGYMVENRPVYISQTFSQSDNPAASLMPNAHGANDDHESSDSEMSSFLGTYQGPADDDSCSECEGSELGDCHHCDVDAMVINFQAICGLPVSNYRSKPLPKPIVWKGYTCLRSSDSDAPPATEDSRNEENKRSKGALRKYEDWHKSNEGRTDASNDGLSSEDSKSEITCEEASQDEQHGDFFQSTVVQEYLDYAKETAQDFLKNSIFLDDPDVFVGKDVVYEDSDSMTNGSV